MNEIIKAIEELSGKYSEKEIFRDFVTMTSISISNVIRMDECREKEFMQIKNKYTSDEYKSFMLMYNVLVSELENNPRDILGEIFQKMNVGNSKDQFFTPLSIAKMISEMTEEKSINGHYTVADPACGSGVMIIAKALSLGKRGVNYQTQMTAIASDVDRTVLLMCYIQLSLLGISAICEVKNTLSNEVYETWYTVMYQYKYGTKIEP